LKLPRGAGTAIFAGGGAWLPRAGGETSSRGGTSGRGDASVSGQVSLRGDEAVILSDPVRILVATRPDELWALLGEIEAEQLAGRYVAGYLAYEAGAAFGLTVRSGPARPLPDGALGCDTVPLAWMAVYEPESAVIVPAKAWARVLDKFDVSPAARLLSTLKLELNVSEKEYGSAIARVREYIAAGDTYQVNYTVRGRYDLSDAGDGAAAGADKTAPGDSGRAGESPPKAQGPLDPLVYFLALVIRQSVPYAAFLDLGETQVVSLSPELFLRRDGEQLESRPMKGTRPRGASHPQDVALAYELAETEKERAENLMIVDMVRNDLGRVCRTGTVHVPTLYAVEPYRTVWQMTSTVQGLLHPGTSLADIMKAVSPGASITGAPKHHTMEIIAEVETEPRGVYTGAVALFSPGGDFVGNIGIRTILHRGGRCTLGVGSGIVWDATAPAEYEETLAKGAFALAPAGGDWRPAAAQSAAEPAVGTDVGLDLFETLLLQSDGHYRDLEQHLARIAASAKALGFRFDGDLARDALATLAAREPRPCMVRLDLAAGGDMGLSTREAPVVPDAPVTLLVSPFRTEQDDPLLAHKTTRRGFYDREHRRAVAQDCYDALFVNRLDHVTEGGITNLFARFGDLWVTPPLEDGLLPGVWRAAFAAETGAVERSLTLQELLQADEIVVGNSARGAVAVGGLLADPLTY
jgi:para-aminobenzoate synthetase / 4-amino-4-deoxychorismate lyase